MSTSERADGLPAAWAAWADMLETRLAALADGEQVVVVAAGAARKSVARPKLLFGLIPARYVDCAPTITLIRREDHLHGSLTGSESFGGPLPMSPQEDVALKALSWRDPGSGFERTWLRYWPDDVALAPWPASADLVGCADVVARTFHEVYAVGSPEDVLT